MDWVPRHRLSLQQKHGQDQPSFNLGASCESIESKIDSAAKAFSSTPQRTTPRVRRKMMTWILGNEVSDVEDYANNENED